LGKKIEIPVLLDILHKDNVIDEKQLKKSIARHKKSNMPVGLILLEEGYISADILTSYLSKEYDITHPKKD
jgi:hypothetical protein